MDQEEPLYRIGLMLLGLSALALGAAGVFVAVSSAALLHIVMEGIRAAVFVACGVVFLSTASTANRTDAKSIFLDFVRDVFSPRNLSEFAAFWLIAGAALLAMMFLRV